MALIVKERVRETSTTSGTGTLSLGGALLGFQSFGKIGDGNETYYTIVDAATGDWEVGIGTYAGGSPATLSRDTVIESSNSDAKVNFAGNLKDVFCVYPADRSVSQADIGTAPNEIPLNQYLGSMAYQDAENIAGDVGVGGDLSLNSGTANGVVYLNGSKVATSGSSLTFDGTNLGIGTSSPSASAILDAQSTTKGVRMPNMTTAQKNAIASPAAGLMVFDTTLSKLCVYTGVAWETVTSI